MDLHVKCNPTKTLLMHLGPRCLLQILGLSLPHQHARKRKGKESFVDYIKSNVVTFNEHLNILWHKAMEKDVAEKIRKQKKKERGGEKS
jgi:hypothetical protein